MESVRDLFCKAPEALHAEIIQKLSDCKITFTDSSPSSKNSLYLEVDDQQKAKLTNSEGLTLSIDFDHDHLNYQRKNLRGKNEPLFRALGGQKGLRKVHDLSVGTGIDFILALQLGFQVSGNERSSLIYFLLHQALQKSQLSYLKDVSLVHEDARQILLNKKYPTDLEVFYFDPMYPHKKGSALPRKEMQIFRSLVGTDDDAEEVLALALESEVPRVVLKRPVGAPLLLKPTYSVETKIVRFDIYQRS